MQYAEYSTLQYYKKISEGASIVTTSTWNVDLIFLYTCTHQECLNNADMVFTIRL